eukprot:1182862-Prorocentrum_minimum.AAC.2
MVSTEVSRNIPPCLCLRPAGDLRAGGDREGAVHPPIGPRDGLHRAHLGSGLRGGLRSKERHEREKNAHHNREGAVVFSLFGQYHKSISHPTSRGPCCEFRSTYTTTVALGCCVHPCRYWHRRTRENK